MWFRASCAAFVLTCGCGRIAFDSTAGNGGVGDGALPAFDSSRVDPWAPVAVSATVPYKAGAGAWVAWTGDRFVAAWNTVGGAATVAAYDVSGTEITPPRTLATTALAGPLVAVNGELAMLAVEDSGIASLRFAADGTNLREAAIITTGYLPDFTLSATGDALCGIWYDGGQIYAATFELDGTVRGAPHLASTAGTVDGFQQPRVGCRGDRLYALWITRVAGSDRIHYRVWAGATTLVAETELPVPATGATVQLVAAVLGRSDTRPTVVYRVVGPNGYGLRIAQFDELAGGSLVAPEVLPLAETAQLGWTGERFLFAWSQLVDTSREVEYASVLSDLTFADAPVAATQDTAVDEHPMSIARAPTGEIAIGFQADDINTLITTANLVFLR